MSKKLLFDVVRLLLGIIPAIFLLSTMNVLLSIWLVSWISLINLLGRIFFINVLKDNFVYYRELFFYSLIFNITVLVMFFIYN